MSFSNNNPSPYFSESPSGYRSFEAYPESHLTDNTSDLQSLSPIQEWNDAHPAGTDEHCTVEDFAMEDTIMEDVADNMFVDAVEYPVDDEPMQDATVEQPNPTESQNASNGSDPDSDEEISTEEEDNAGNLQPPYPMDSVIGQILIDRIRKHLSLPEDTPTEQVQTHLSNNPSILRHLRSGSVAHPGQYVIDTHGQLREPMVSRRSRQRNLFLLMDIQEIAWTDSMLRDALFIVADRDRDAVVFVREELRKMFTGDVAQQVLLRRRAEDSEYAQMVDAQKQETLLLRELRPNSLLREAVSADDE